MAKLRLKNLNKITNKTVGEIYKDYLNYCTSIGQREKTIESKEKFGKYELIKVVNLDSNIKELTKEKIEKHIINMRKEGYKGNTYQTYVIKMRAFLSYCFNNNYLTKFTVKIPNILLEKKEVYTEEEVIKLLKKPSINTCLVGDFRSWAICSFLLGTGCRAETLLNVHVEDINFEIDSVLFRHMKTKKQITVPLSNTLKVNLMEYVQRMGLKQEDYLFPLLNGKKMKYDTCHQNLKNYFRHRKIKFHGVNTFRNTFATLFIKNGGDLYRLKSILCHSNIKTTERYVNLLPLDLSEDIQKFNPLDVLSKKTMRMTIKRGGRR
ncbi:integrase [Clostridium botulinum B2 433]|uniref:tyrosine-type recombinase/integrase n=1 Tax=Clostridium botulinum TaxID=1491 RepID=UPI0007E05F80|nr:site-specific integrase [Clostridium botulinum]KEI89302.1 integrase [Clostridium botulinum B2 433]